MPVLEAVLWDLDGTLVDTEPLWMQGEHELAAEYGATWTHDDAIALVGLGLLDAGLIVKERMNIPLTPAQIVERLVGHMVEALKQDVPWRAGALELLTDLHSAGFPLALVTMSYRAIADVVAEQAGVFTAVVTGDEVARPKPFPDPYLQAAAALGVDARNCVALEDSSTGARSALDAGCTTIVLDGYAPVDPALGHARWSSLAERRIPDVQSVFSASVTS